MHKLEERQRPSMETLKNLYRQLEPRDKLRVMGMTALSAVVLASRTATLGFALGYSSYVRNASRDGDDFNETFQDIMNNNTAAELVSFGAKRIWGIAIGTAAGALYGYTAAAIAYPFSSIAFDPLAGQILHNTMFAASAAGVIYSPLASGLFCWPSSLWNDTSYPETVTTILCNLEGAMRKMNGKNDEPARDPSPRQ